MGYVLGHLAALLLIGALFYITGHLVFRRLAIGPSPVGGLIIRIFLGIAVWIVLLLTAGVSGLYTPRVLQVLALSVLVGGVVVLALDTNTRRWLRRARKGQHESVGAGWRPTLRDHQDVAPYLAVTGATLAVVSATLLLQAIRPNVSWDAAVYHLTLPRLYLESGRMMRIPFNVYSVWPHNVELLFGLAMAIHDHVLAKLLHFGFGVVLLAAVFRVTRTSACPLVACWATSLLLINPVLLYEIRIAYIDLAASLFFFLALIFVDQARRVEDHRRGWLLLSGVSCGLMAGTKLNGIFGLLCMIAVLASEMWRSPRALLRSSLTIAVPCVLLAAPWPVRSLVLTGNPAYPLLFDLFGGPEWSRELAEGHRAWQQSIGMGRGWQDYLLLPLRVPLCGGFGYHRFDGRISPLWLVLLPATVLGLRSGPLVRRCLVAAVCFFLLWSASSQQMRLLIPVLPLLATATALGLNELIAGSASRWRPRLGALTSLLMIASVLQASWVYLQQNPRLLRAYLEHGGELEERVVHPIYSFIDAELPENARILLLNTNRGFFVRRDFVADSFFEASQIVDWLRRATSPQELDRQLEGAGVTHLLVENRDVGVRYPEALVEYLQDQKMVRIVARSPDGRFTLFALRANERIARGASAPERLGAGGQSRGQRKNRRRNGPPARSGETIWCVQARCIPSQLLYNT